MKHLQNIGWETGGGPSGEDAFGGCGCLRSGLEEDGIAAEDGGEDGVDGGEVGEVPWRDDSGVSGVLLRWMWRGKAR